MAPPTAVKIALCCVSAIYLLWRQRYYILNNNIPDTVPDDVSCNKIKICDQYHTCIIGCERGSVKIDPWLSYSLETQRELAYTQSICDAQLPGTHNSAITLADGYGVEDHVFEKMLHFLKLFNLNSTLHTNDQLFSLTDQLRMGIRFLELDIHWFDNDLRIAHCGGFSSPALDMLIASLNAVSKFLGLKIQWDSETIGCKPSLSSIPASEQRHIEDVFKEIKEWMLLPENKNEFLIIFFDDEYDLKQWHKVSQLIKSIHKYFNPSEIFTPLDSNRTRSSFPIINSLLSNGKRLMFLSGIDYTLDMNCCIFSKKKVCNWTEPDLPLLPFPKCIFPSLNTTRRTRNLTRPESIEIRYGPLNAEGHFGPNKGLLDENTLPDIMKCGIHIPSPDNITPKRMEAMIWSWNIQQEHVLKNKCTILDLKTRKWKSHLCNDSLSLPFACKVKGRINKWILSKKGFACSSNCPKESYFSVPVDGYDNELLLKLLQEQQEPTLQVWLNLQRKGACERHILTNLTAIE